MKKILLFLSIFLLTSSVGWAESYNITFKVGVSDGSTAATAANFINNCISSGAEYLVSCASTNSCFYPGKNGVKIGSSSYAGSFSLNLKEDYQVIPTKITITAYTASASVILTVNGIDISLTQNEEKDYTISPSGKITSISATNNGAKKVCYIKSISVEYSTAPATQVSTPTFTPPAGTYNASQSVALSCDTEGASIYYTTDGAEPTNTSTPYSAAIAVEKNTTIKAIAIKDGLDNSEIGSAIYNLQPVVAISPDATTKPMIVTLSSTPTDAAIYYTINGDTPTTASTPYTAPFQLDADATVKAIAVKTDWTDSEVASKEYTYVNKNVAIFDLTTNPGSLSSIVKNDITLSFTKDNGGTAPVFNTNHIRAYSKNKINFDAGAFMIKTIEFTFTSSSYNFCAYTNQTLPTLNTGIYSGNKADDYGSWTGESSIVSMIVGPTSTSGQARIQKIVVVYEEALITKVFTPTFTPAGGTSSYDSQTVTIACATEGATIHYTTDGTTPDANSTVYTAPITLTTTTTINAIAVKDGLDNSEIATATYTVTPTSILDNIAAFEALDDNVAAKITGAVTVIYQSGKYLFVQDTSGALQVYGTLTNTYKNGDVLTGISGTVGTYAGLKQMVPNDDSFGTATAGTAVVAQDMAIDGSATALVNKLVKITNVTVALVSNKNYTLTQGSNILDAYARFDDVTIPTDTKAYDVTGVLNTYNGAYQLFPTAFTENIPTPVDENLSELLTNGVAGDTYAINLPLVGVYSSGPVLYAKTETQDNCSNVSAPTHSGLDSYEDNVNNFEQRDWIALQLGSAVTASGCVGKTISTGLVGNYSSDATPKLVVTSLPSLTSNPNTLEFNSYQVCNFLASQYATPEYTPFWVEPKMNEVATMVGYIKAVDGTCYLYDRNLDENKRLAIENTAGYELEEAVTGNYRKFKAIVMRKTKAVSGTVATRSLPAGYEYVLKALEKTSIATGVEGVTGDNGNGAKAVGTIGAVKFVGLDENGAEAMIFDAAGRIVRQATVVDGETLPMASGYYIVKVGNARNSVIVK